MPRLGRGPRPSRLVVREHSPWRQWLIVGGSAALVALVSFVIYKHQVSRLPYEWEQMQGARSRLESERDRLQDTIRDLRMQNKQQAEKIVMLERGMDVDKAAKEEVRQSLSDQQQQISALKEQLAFYRGIVSPEQSKAGLRVFQFTVRPDPGHAGLYVYELVLIQALRHDRNVGGRADVEIHGLKDGKSVSYKLSDVGTGGANALTFDFKYFQKLDGSFRLPDGVTPTSVKVDLDSQSAPEVSSTYKWSQVLHTAGDK